jgi:hypothetical protein
MAHGDQSEGSRRQWITGLVVIASTIIGFYGFARLSRGWTLVVSIGILVGLVAFFWMVGRSRSRGPR